jgi:hypothetical protein
MMPSRRVADKEATIVFIAKLKSQLQLQLD